MITAQRADDNNMMKENIYVCELPDIGCQQ